MTPTLTIVIPARNEARHIVRAVSSATRLAESIWVVDSHSTDDTKALAEQAGARVVNCDGRTFSEKLNWAVANLAIETPWIMRLDADERVSDAMAEELPAALERLPADVCGVYVRRQLWFMGQWIRHGGMYPTWSMRIWRPGTATCESRDLDEHMLLHRGSARWIKLDVIDDPLTDLTTWIDKHNRYATMEVATARARSSQDLLLRPRLLGTSIERARWLKLNVFYRVPGLFRATLYFAYRYVLRGGFLDGRKGLIFHVLHGFWYRFLVDAKLFELTDAEKRADASRRDRNGPAT
jgi:glycosyltransferase involved in cell wall biosynthesis